MKHRFYGTLSHPDKNPRTLIGDKTKGLRGVINGWDAGVLVNAYVNPKDQDCFRVSATKGSNDTQSTIYLGTVVDTETGPVWNPA